MGTSRSSSVKYVGPVQAIFPHLAMGGVVINTCVWRHFLTPSDRGLYERYHAKSEEGPPFDTSNRAIAGSQVRLATP